MLATVHDKQGKIVSNLTKDDFDLTDEGRPQTIRYFSRETDLPLLRWGCWSIPVSASDWC